MSEQEITDVLSRSADRLEPDVDGMVARAAARGRKSLRRRRFAGAAAAVVLVGAVAATTPGWIGSDDRGVDDVATQPPDTAGQRTLSDGDTIRARLDAAPSDGDLENLEVTPYEDGAGLDVSMRFNGHRVELEVERSLPPEYFSEDPGSKPRDCDESQFPDGHGVATIDALRNMTVHDGESARCLNWVTATREGQCVTDARCWDRFYAEFLSGNPCLKTPTLAGCTQLPDGSWLYVNSRGAAEGDTVSIAELSTYDKFQIRAEAPGSALSPDQLGELVASEVWFEQ